MHLYFNMKQKNSLSISVGVFVRVCVCKHIIALCVIKLTIYAQLPGLWDEILYYNLINHESICQVSIPECSPLSDKL